MRRVARIIVALVVIAAVALALLWTTDTNPAAMRAQYGGPPSQFVRLAEGLTVHLRDEGPRDAPVIMLLHGSNASLHTWDDWAARLTPRYRVVRFDQIGHGLTGPHPRRDYSAAAFVDTVERVRARLGIERMVLAGNSMGGRVAWRYAIAHPDRLSALVLVAPSGAPAADDAKTPLAFRIAASPVLRPLLLKVTPRRLVASALRGAVHDERQVSEADVDRYWSLLRYPGNRQATVDRQVAGRWTVDDAGVRSIATPTLILWGANDRVLPVDGARWFGDRIAGATSIVYPAVGHIPMEEVADRSASDAVEFLGRIDPHPRLPGLHLRP